MGARAAQVLLDSWDRLGLTLAGLLDDPARLLRLHRSGTQWWDRLQARTRAAVAAAVAGDPPFGPGPHPPPAAARSPPSGALPQAPPARSQPEPSPGRDPGSKGLRPRAVGWGLPAAGSWVLEGPARPWVWPPPAGPDGSGRAGEADPYGVRDLGRHFRAPNP